MSLHLQNIYPKKPFCNFLEAYYTVSQSKAEIEFTALLFANRQSQVILERSILGAVINSTFNGFLWNAD